jgi:hypothetical protein
MIFTLSYSFARKGFEVTDIMVIPDAMKLDTVSGDYGVWFCTRALLERPNQ